MTQDFGTRFGPPSAVILAGGAGSRLGGVDKALLEYDGETLLGRLIVAFESVVSEIVIVGEPRDLAFNTTTPIIWTVEEPVRGGPLAGLAAGVEKLSGHDRWFFALACDQPFAARAIVPLLAAAQQAGPEVDGILGKDQGGRSQALTAIYRKAAVDRVFEGLGSPDGLPMRALIKRLNAFELELPAGASQDVDTTADIIELGINNPRRNNV